MTEKKGIVLTDEQKRRRRGRNFAIGVVLALLVVVFYLVTVFRLGGNVFNRAI